MTYEHQGTAFDPHASGHEMVGRCPKCNAISGDDWSQCDAHLPCPMGGPRLAPARSATSQWTDSNSGSGQAPPRDDLNALLRVRGSLAMDGDAAFGAVVTSGMSITRSATETAPNFVRRLVLGALDAAIEVHSP